MDKSTLLSVFVQYLLPVFATALAGGLSWVLGLAGLWLKTKATQSKLASALAQITFIVETVVARVEAAERPLVKEFTADGHISKAEGKRLMDLAVSETMAVAKERGFEEARKLLETFSPAVEAMLRGIIERALLNLPNSKPSLAIVEASPIANP